MNFRDAYRDMLRDYGFRIKLCLFSRASTRTTNHINNDTVVSAKWIRSDEADVSESRCSSRRWEGMMA